MGVKNWTVELKGEVYSIRLAFVWRKQHECNVGDMIRAVKERHNDTERQNFQRKGL
jgi:hypothetical protein